MSLSYRVRPGRGFVLLVAMLLASATLLAWGLATPPLEHVWRLQLELILGERGALEASEKSVFQDALVRYPEMADNLLDGARYGLVSAHVDGVVHAGYAYGLRRAATPCTLRVTSTAEAQLTLRVRASGLEAVGIASGQTPFLWPVPNEGPFPQLIEILSESAPSAITETAPMRVELCATP